MTPSTETNPPQAWLTRCSACCSRFSTSQVAHGAEMPILVIIALLLVAGHLVALGRNTNANLATNFIRAQRLVHQGQLFLDTPGPRVMPPGIPDPGRSSPVRLVAFVLVLLAIPGAMAPEVMRLARGWPSNPGFYPPVFGPGGTVRLFMPRTISSLGGMWNGVATCTCLNAADLGAPETQASG